MNYYKVVVNGVIIGAVCDYDFRRWQAKHGVVIVSDADNVECVQIGESYYRDSWMKAGGNIPGVMPAAITRITEEEYNSLKAQLDAGDIPDDGSLEEEEPAEQVPAEEGSEEVRKTAAQLLREQINNVDSQVKLAARFASV